MGLQLSMYLLLSRKQHCVMTTTAKDSFLSRDVCTSWALVLVIGSDPGQKKTAVVFSGMRANAVVQHWLTLPVTECSKCWVMSTCISFWVRCQAHEVCYGQGNFCCDFAEPVCISKVYDPQLSHCVGKCPCEPLQVLKGCGDAC